MEQDILISQYETSLGSVIVIDHELCNGCNSCVTSCRQHILLPALKKKDPPVKVNIEECWFCGSCALACPRNALKLIHPLVRRVGWKRKATDEYFRVGMKNPPPPITRPLVA